MRLWNFRSTSNGLPAVFSGHLVTNLAPPRRRSRVILRFSDFFFRPDNLTEAIIVIRLETFTSTESALLGGM